MCRPTCMSCMYDIIHTCKTCIYDSRLWFQSSHLSWLLAFDSNVTLLVPREERRTRRTLSKEISTWKIGRNTPYDLGIDSYTPKMREEMLARGQANRTFQGRPCRRRCAGRYTFASRGTSYTCGPSLSCTSASVMAQLRARNKTTTLAACSRCTCDQKENEYEKKYECMIWIWTSTPWKIDTNFRTNLTSSPLSTSTHCQHADKTSLPRVSGK